MSIASWIRFERPQKDDGIDDVIESAHYILELPDNFDGEGSGKYDRETLSRAAEILRIYAEALSREGFRIETPRILPGPDGSIDIHWKTGEFELLINIPVESDARITYYGDDYGKNSIKGSSDSKLANPAILGWLRK